MTYVYGNFIILYGLLGTFLAIAYIGTNTLTQTVFELYSYQHSPWHFFDNREDPVCSLSAARGLSVELCLVYVHDPFCMMNCRPIAIKLGHNL